MYGHTRSRVGCAGPFLTPSSDADMPSEKIQDRPCEASLRSPVTICPAPRNIGELDLRKPQKWSALSGDDVAWARTRSTGTPSRSDRRNGCIHAVDVGDLMEENAAYHR